MIYIIRQLNVNLPVYFLFIFQYDFTGCGIYLFVAAMVMFIFGIIAIFTYSRILYTIYSAGIALLFSMVRITKICVRLNNLVCMSLAWLYLKQHCRLNSVYVSIPFIKISGVFMERGIVRWISV